MLVEDNADEVVLTQLAFDKCRIGKQLIVVRDGREALDFLFARGSYSYRDPDDKPSLILLDLNLPIISGLHVLEIIREARNINEIPIVVLTSSSEQKDRIESLKAGANDYINKPTAFSEFVELVHQFNSRWLQL